MTSWYVHCDDCGNVNWYDHEDDAQDRAEAHAAGHQDVGVSYGADDSGEEHTVGREVL